MPHNKAFSILELLCCLFLVTIICFLAIPNFIFLDKKMVIGEVNAFYFTILHARQLAITSNKQLELKINLDENSYEYMSRKKTLPPKISFGSLPKILGPPSLPQKTILYPTFKNNRIIFYPNGNISPGTIYLKDNKDVYAITCPVSQVSYVRKYKNKDNEWIKC